MEKHLSRTDAQDLQDYKQAAAVEAGLRREFLARAQKAEAEIEWLRAENKKLQEQFLECNVNFIKSVEMNERLLKKIVNGLQGETETQG